MRQKKHTLDDLVKIEGPEMGFEVERMPEAIERDGPERTFSAEALDEIFLNIRAFVASRVVRNTDFFDGTAPHKLSIRISVGIDGKPAR